MSDGKKDISVRISVVDGKKATAELVGFGKQGAAAIREVDKAGMNTQGLQNLGYQVQDVIVQAQGGTDVMRALSMQLPQMLMGFGMAGVVIGTAAAAFLPLIGNMLSAGNEAESLEEQIKTLATGMNNLDAATKGANSPVEDILKTYGDYADQAANLLAIQRELAYVDATKALTATVRGIADAFGELERLGPPVKELPQYIQAFQAPFGQLNADRVTDMAEALDITKEEAIRLAQAMVALDDASGPQAQVEALRAIISALDEATGGATEMNDEAAKIYNFLLDALDAALRLSAVDLVSNVTPAADEAGRLARNFAAALSLQNQMAAQTNSGGRGDGMAEWRYRQSGVDPEAGAFVYDGPTLDVNNNPVVKGGRKGGGGGGASKAKNEAEREAERVYAATRTEAEKYAAELEKLNKLQEGGYITADTYARALSQAQEALAKSDETAKFWRDEMDDLNQGILDAITNGGSLSDVLGDVGKALERAAWEAALFGTGPMARGGGFSLLGGLNEWVSGLMSFDGGGHTGNGARSGGLDGRGGFLAIMHPRERVEDLTRPQSGGGAGALQISLGPGLQAEWLGQSGLQARIISQETATRQARGLPAAMRHMQARGTSS